jgi:hypothetical protein
VHDNAHQLHGDNINKSSVSVRPEFTISAITSGVAYFEMDTHKIDENDQAGDRVHQNEGHYKYRCCNWHHAQISLVHHRVLVRLLNGVPKARMR